MRVAFRTALFFKAVLAIFVVSLVVGLIIDSSPREGRQKTIESALISGRIGHLESARSAYLKTVLSAIADEAELNEDVVLNSTERPTSLHVYTTSPEMESLTGCGRGNAVYDAAEDTIFIDESLVNPTDFVNLGEETQHSSSITVDDIPPLKTYLIFLLSHELGHRILHRHASASFDIGRSTDRRRELEADEFARALLERALVKRSLLTESIFAKGYIYGLPITEETPPRDRAWLALVEMAHFISVSTLFSATPLSAIYQDSAHPSFLDRTESIIGAALLDESCSAKLQEYFRLANEAIERVRSITKHQVVELVFYEPIYDISFNPEGMLMVPENPTRLYYLTAKDIKGFGKGMARTVNVSPENAVAGTGFPELGPGNTRQYAWSKIWSTPSNGAYSIQPGQIFLSNGGFWEPTSGEIESELSKYTIQNVSTAPQPSPIAVVEASTAGGENILLSLCDGRVCAQREVRAIASEANFNSKFIFLNTITDDAIYLEVHDETANGGVGSLRGVIKLDSGTLGVKRAIPLTSEVCSVTTESAAIWDSLSFVVVPESGSERFICIANRHDTPDQWYAFELKPDDLSGEDIVSAPFLVGILHKSKQELDDFEDHNYLPSGLSAKWVGGSQVILQLFNDSAWLIDLRARKSTVLFHPGGGATRVAIGRTSLAIFYRSGYKCYVVVSPSVD